MSISAKPRMNWLDGARLAAAFCIIGIHSSADFHGNAFAREDVSDRIFPILFRAMSEVASTEFFILVSLFLLSLKLAKDSAGFIETMLIQARRLLVPFAVWTVFYAFFRLYKAYYLDYDVPLWQELSSVTNWVGYFLLGDAQFHMHFLPTLFLLLMFHRVFRLAVPYPLLGLIVVPMMAINFYFGEWIWANVQHAEVRDYLLRLAKVITYTGYGFFAFSVYGLWERGLDKDRCHTVFGCLAFLVAIGVLLKLVYAFQVIGAGEWIVRRNVLFYSHYLFPCLMLLLFLSSQYFKWPDRLSYWSKFSFGMYLIHPAVLDVLEVTLTEYTLDPAFYVLIKYLFTAIVTFGLAIAIGKIRLLAWTTGLGPLPFSKEFREQSIKRIERKSENGSQSPAFSQA